MILIFLFSTFIHSVLWRGISVRGVYKKFVHWIFFCRRGNAVSFYSGATFRGKPHMSSVKVWSRSSEISAFGVCFSERTFRRVGGMERDVLTEQRTNIKFLVKLGKKRPGNSSDVGSGLWCLPWSVELCINGWTGSRRGGRASMTHARGSLQHHVSMKTFNVYTIWWRRAVELPLKFYVEVLKRLRERVRRARPEMWAENVWILHQDNAHRARYAWIFGQKQNHYHGPPSLFAWFGALWLIPVP